MYVRPVDDAYTVGKIGQLQLNLLGQTEHRNGQQMLPDHLLLIILEMVDVA